MAGPAHVPVLLTPLLANVAPVSGTWLDGTFGAGGYCAGLIEAGATRVIGVDRDPSTKPAGDALAAKYSGKFIYIDGEFGDLADIAAQYAGGQLSGVVLDIGVSSMQIDQAERGFSFAKLGPLDMRMAQTGPSAADLVNRAEESALADILFQFGEERASRRIARAIVAARAIEPITTTQDLAEIVSKCLPRPKPGQIHPATRSFQALRIAVNDELGQLAMGLEGAEAALAPGGLLAVVTFHSLEDRMVKRFMAGGADDGTQVNRYAPAGIEQVPRWERVTRKAITADDAECAANPRARSARLRIARRSAAPAGPVSAMALGAPRLNLAEVWA